MALTTKEDIYKFDPPIEIRQDIKTYPNDSPYVKYWTSDIMENIMQDMRYTGTGKERNSKLEKDNSIPLFIWTFTNFFDELGTLPTEQMFIDEYFDTNTHKLRHYTKSAVSGRIYRTYPSLLRERHIILLLSEDNAIDAVYYSPIWDSNGVDCFVYYKGIWFDLDIFIDSKKAKEYRKKKDKWKNHLTTVNVQVPVNRKIHCKDIGISDKAHELFSIGTLNIVDIIKDKMDRKIKILNNKYSSTTI